MNRRMLAATGIALALTTSTLAIVFLPAEAAPAPAITAVVPAKADNFVLTDQTGFGHELYRYKESPAIVIVSQANGDAVSRKAAKTVKFLKATFPSAQFFMLNSNPADTRAAIAAEAKAQGIDTPILMDSLQIIGESLGVTQTGEAFLIDPVSWKIVYHGAVDASLAGKTSEPYFLTNALLDQLSHRPLSTSYTPAKGSVINFPARGAAKTYTAISYAKTIAPILESKCVDCHQQGGIGPFAMSSYDVVKGYSPMIRETLRTDRMPPWHADDDIGVFQHNKSLSKD
ncbi:MAG TPA: hypothetical protein VG942_08605, partial [Hyphomonadaceae bacterium]|nr:hypothetical protein [Hyphomonadaceae bacterium]